MKNIEKYEEEIKKEIANFRDIFHSPNSFNV